MTVKVRNLQVDAKTAELLEARAAARGLSVAELLADLAAADEALPPALEAMRNAGTGPWAADTDARELVVPFGRSAYVVRYALLTETDEVVVLRVWHGREQRE